MWQQGGFLLNSRKLDWPNAWTLLTSNAKILSLDKLGVGLLIGWKLQATLDSLRTNINLLMALNVSEKGINGWVTSSMDMTTYLKSEDFRDTWTRAATAHAATLRELLIEILESNSYEIGPVGKIFELHFQCILNHAKQILDEWDVKCLLKCVSVIWIAI